MTSYRKKTLLVVDDDRLFCQAVQDFFRRDSLEILLAHCKADAVKIYSEKKIDVVLLDQKLPDGEGQTLCPSILKHNDQTKIIFITAYPSFENAVAAIKAGAHDYLSKPFELEELKLALDQALRTLDLEKVEQLQSYKRRKESEETVFIGGEGELAAVREIMELAAAAPAPVLITGETGTGKNVVAKCIHYWGPAAANAFISINCNTFPENLMEAELFGYEKGAFTGAVSAHKGIFEMAEGGTLFLDEIGGMPLQLQSKLLSVLEDKKIKRLGGESFRPVYVRTIAATNTELEKAVKEKKFREDLYYRLNVIRIHLPPLRERLRDLPDLCRHLIRQSAGGRELDISREEMAKLTAYPWPGNVRELKNVLERAALLQKGPALQPSEFLYGLMIPPPEHLPPPVSAPPAGTAVEPLEEVEKKYIQHALSIFAGNHTHAAKALGISLSTLKRKLKEYSRKQ